MGKDPSEKATVDAGARHATAAFRQEYIEISLNALGLPSCMCFCEQWVAPSIKVYYSIT